MKIDVLCNDGSPLGVCETTIQGDGFRVGVGGSELALLTMCRAWHDAGHIVTLYNNPWQPDGSAFPQCMISAFDPSAQRDILIVFRSPNPRAIPARGKKVWWSCDQYSTGNYANFSPYMDQIVTISPFHAEYFEQTYQIHGCTVIDLPVRDDVFQIEKVPNRLIFTSVPDRGLGNLWRIYPKIRQYFPGMTLAITSDYRLWGAGELNHQHRVRWLVHEGVEFLGAIPRSRYVQELAKADLMLYPGTYDELFCISVAEAQAAGVVCVTSARGALATTNLGHIFNVDSENPHNDSLFIDRVRSILSNRIQMELDREVIASCAWERYSLSRVMSLWNKHVFEGEV